MAAHRGAAKDSFHEVAGVGVEVRIAQVPPPKAGSWASADENFSSVFAMQPRNKPGFPPLTPNKPNLLFQCAFLQLLTHPLV